MEYQGDPKQALREFLDEALKESLEGRLRLYGIEDVEQYLLTLLVEFLSFDDVYRLRDAYGKPVRDISEMLAEGDVLQKANSFDREREVHRYIGDFMLFWSGLFPENLPAVAPSPLDPVMQGKASYHVVSTFDYGRYADQAHVFRKLSDGFEEFQEGLKMLRRQMPGFSC